MQVDRGTFYNHIFRNKKDNTWYAKRREILREEILKIYEENRQIFGAGKITAILKQKGYRTSEETVSFLMHDMGLQSIRHRAKAIYEKEVKAKNKVNQQFQTTRPNEVWVSNVTYFRTPYNSYYICVKGSDFNRFFRCLRCPKKLILSAVLSFHFSVFSLFALRFQTVQFQVR